MSARGKVPESSAEMAHEVEKHRTNARARSRPQGHGSPYDPHAEASSERRDPNAGETRMQGESGRVGWKGTHADDAVPG